MDFLSFLSWVMCIVSWRHDTSPRLPLHPRRRDGCSRGSFERRRHHLFKELVDLLGGAAGEARWIEQSYHNILRKPEVWVADDFVDECVRAVFLQLELGLHAVAANLFMQLLPIPAS